MKRTIKPAALRTIQQTIDALGDHVAILNEQAEIVMVNTAWRRFGEENGLRLPKHGLGTNYLALCNLAEGESQESAHCVAENISELLRERQGDFICEYACHGPDEQRWFQVRGTCLNEGGELYLVLAHQNITRVRRSQEAVAASEAKLQALLNATTESALLMGLDGTILTANALAAQRFGQTTAGIVGKNLFDLSRPAVAAQRREHARQVAQTARPVRFQDTHEGRTYDICGYPVLNAQGTVIMIAVFASDITERTQAEAALENARAALQAHATRLEHQVQERTAQLRSKVEELEAFSYSLSHDMRAPVRAVCSFAELVRSQCQARVEPTTLELLNRIVAAGQRMDNLILDVLTLSRVSRQLLTLQRIDLDKLAGEILAERPEFQPPQALVEIPRPLLPVVGHVASLTQCLTNLLSNAVRFVAPGVQPRVRLHTEPRNGRVRLWVEDNGIGIAPEDQAKIFDIFHRLHPRKYEGTGIGLAIVRKAVERMGGDVGVESQVGGGSRFWLELPAP